MGGKLHYVFDTNWSSSLAYAVGLITSDGYLRSDTAEINFTSKDYELVRLYRESLRISKKIRRNGTSGTSSRKYYTLRFKSRQLHTFLHSVGITSAKSKTIKSVTVPDDCFADFVRGVFDGDGTFYTHWDTRWPNSFVFHIEIASASEQFICWLQEQLQRLYGTKGFIKRGDGVFILRFAKGDTKILFDTMYYQIDIPFLERKYRKIKDALDFNDKLKQNTIHAAVAQW